MLVSSNEDCPTTLDGKQYLLTYGKSIGLTSVVATQPDTFSDNATIQPVGNGYVANRNRVLGGVSRESTKMKAMLIFFLGNSVKREVTSVSASVSRWIKK